MSEFSQRLAVVIGINQYENGISSLQNAVNDAEQINWILKEQHGYKTWLLLDRDATQDKLKELLTETLRKEVKPDECLLFYFAGHGKAENEDDGPQGYLIPQNARFGDASSCLPMSHVHNWLTALPCRHFLAILDCCFAGAFRWSSTRDGATVPEEIFLEHYYRFIQDPAWQVITSASYDQTALDIFSLKDCRGQKGNHSPFAAALIDALKGEADTSPPAKDGKPKGDGVITATELYLYLRDRIEPATIGIEKRQTPGLWHLKNHDRGEYIFLTPGHELNLRNAPSLDESKNPYRGLESFDEDHKDWFFGRTAFIDRLYKEFVNDKALTVVLGASGAGKSSLVKAGLIPELRKNQPHWTILDPIRLGESPFHELNNALKKANLPEVEVPDTALAQSIKNLNESIKIWVSNNQESKLLLFIDQSEELITLCKNDIERQEFLSQLAHAITTHSHQLRVVITVRSDFEPQLRDLVVNLLPNTLQLENTAIRESWQNGRITVPTMTRTELRDAIEKPAEARVMYFDPHSLVDELINEVADMPGALPLLSFALSELYLKYLKRQKEGRDKGITIDRAITEADYKEIGGVTQSLTQRADQEYQKLVDDDPAYEQIVRNVMLRMVVQGGGELSRRRVPMSELDYPEAIQAQVEEAIQCFSKVRLLIPGKDGEDNPYVEPAHDALVRGWSKIRNWLGERQEKTEKISQFNKIKSLLNERLANIRSSWRLKRNNSIAKQQESEKPLKVNLPLQRQLTTAANNWLSKQEKEGDQKASGFLWYDDPRLPQLEQIQQSDNNWFNQLEAKFVQCSIKRRQNNYHRTVRNLTVVIFMLSGLTIFAFVQLQLSILREKAARTRNLLSVNPLEGLLLAIDATGQNHFWLRWNILSPVQSSLLAALEEAKESNRFMIKGQGSLTAAAFSPNGKYIATGDGFTPVGQPGAKTINGTIWLRDLQGKPIGKPIHHKGRVDNIAFSPSSQYIASKDSEAIKVWDLQGNLIKKESLPYQTAPGSISKIYIGKEKFSLVRNWWEDDIKAFSVDGKYMVKISGTNQELITVSKKARKADKNIYENLITFRGYEGSIMAVKFSQDGHYIIGVCSDNTIRVWQWQSSSIGIYDNPDQYAEGLDPLPITFSANSQSFITKSPHTGIQIWNLEGKKRNSLKSLQIYITSLAVSSNGQYIAGAGSEGLELWDFNGNQIGKLFQGHKHYIESVSFSSDNRNIISGSFDKTIKVWNLNGENTNTIKFTNPPFSFDDFWSIKLVKFNLKNQIVAGISTEEHDFSGLIQVLDINGNPQAKSFGDHWQFALSSDGKYIAAVAKPDNTIQLWNIKGERVRNLFRGHEELITALAFSPDSRFIASASLDKTVRLWDIDGNLINTFRGHQEGTRSISFSPDGQYMASISGDGTVILWPGSWKTVLKVACNRLKQHPVLIKPEEIENSEQRRLAIVVSKTCKELVWNKADNNGQDTPSSSALSKVPALPQNTLFPTPSSNNGQNSYRQALSNRD